MRSVPLTCSEQALDSLGFFLLGGLDVAPDVLGRAVAGGFHGEFHPFFPGKVPKEGMPQHVRRKLYALLLRQLGAGLGGDLPEGAVDLGAGEPSAVAGAEEWPFS